MARKRKAAELKSTDNDAAREQTASPTSEQSKIDWSTIGEFDGFEVSAVRLKPKEQVAKPTIKKQKTTKGSRASQVYTDAPLGAEVVQSNPFPETELREVHWKIKPAREWESTQRYRKFTISGEEFEVNNFVFVKKEAEPLDTRAAVTGWIAKVLEVRAGDSQHVFLRVYWAYRPEDLPGGRQPHHGECELIVSNHMDVIDAMCVQGMAKVIHWDNEQDTKPAPDQLYWRQSFDILKRKGSQLTKLSTHCVDEKPSNPDEPLITCPSCSGLLHARCLKERAVDATHEEHKTKWSTGDTGKTRKWWMGFFTAELSVTETNQLRLTITDKRKGKKNASWDVDVHCLWCAEAIKSLGSDAPAPRTQMGDEDDEEEEEDNTAISPETSSSGVPINEAGLGIADIPTSATVQVTAPAPRPRGRPKGSTKSKARGRPRKANVDAVEHSTSVTREAEHAEEAIAEQPSTTEHAIQITPLRAPEPPSVFQSSVRSVKRLFRL